MSQNKNYKHKSLKSCISSNDFTVKIFKQSGKVYNFTIFLTFSSQLLSHEEKILKKRTSLKEYVYGAETCVGYPKRKKPDPTRLKPVIGSGSGLKTIFFRFGFRFKN